MQLNNLFSELYKALILLRDADTNRLDSIVNFSLLNMDKEADYYPKDNTITLVMNFIFSNVI